MIDQPSVRALKSYLCELACPLEALDICLNDDLRIEPFSAGQVWYIAECCESNGVNLLLLVEPYIFDDSGAKNWRLPPDSED